MKIEQFVVHTEASPEVVTGPRFDIVNNYHRSQGFTKSQLGYYVAYHYFIEVGGEVRQARRDTERGEHTIGANDNSLGICLAGNGDFQEPTPKQVESLRKLLIEKCEQYGVSKDKIYPHRKFRPSKTCYGRLLADDWASKLVEPIIITSTVQAQITILQQLLNLYQQLLAILKNPKVVGSIDREHI